MVWKRSGFGLVLTPALRRRVRARGLQGRRLRVESLWHDQRWVEQDLRKNFTFSLPKLYRKTIFPSSLSIRVMAEKLGQKYFCSKTVPFPCRFLSFTGYIPWLEITCDYF